MRGINLDKRIRAKEEQIQYLRDRQESVSAAFTHASSKTGGKRDRLGDISASVIDLIDEYAAEITELLSVKAEIKRVIDGVESEDYRLLLSLRYESFKTLDEVAVDMGLSLRQIMRKHKNILRILDNVIECHTLDMI
jgi:DNA-directed RNA polymerase specialized sigma subunit